MLENHITVCVRGLALRAMALRRAWTLLESRKNSKPEQYLKTAQTTQRPAHALLGAFYLTTTYNLKAVESLIYPKANLSSYSKIRER